MARPKAKASVQPSVKGKRNVMTASAPLDDTNFGNFEKEVEDRPHVEVKGATYNEEDLANLLSQIENLAPGLSLTISAKPPAQIVPNSVIQAACDAATLRVEDMLLTHKKEESRTKAVCDDKDDLSAALSSTEFIIDRLQKILGAVSASNDRIENKLGSLFGSEVYKNATLTMADNSESENTPFIQRARGLIALIEDGTSRTIELADFLCEQ